MGSKSRWRNSYPEREEKQQKVWKSIEKLFSRYEQDWSPASWKIFVYREGWYLLVRFALLCILFALVSNEFNIWNIIFVIAGVYFLVDILMANTSVSFVTMKPINSLRSFFLTFFAFTHVIVAYGIFYKYFQEQFASNMSNAQLLYFSAVTITTLGDGTFLPDKSGTMVQVLVILELLMGLFFISGVLARIINLKSDTSKGNKSDDENKTRVNKALKTDPG